MQKFWGAIQPGVLGDEDKKRWRKFETEWGTKQVTRQDLRCKTYLLSEILIACPCGPTIHFSFLYVPKYYPNSICEKNTLNFPNSTRKILAMSQNCFEIIAKYKNLCFFLHKNIFMLVFFNTLNRIVEGVWIFSRILKKFDKNLIKYFLTHSQNFMDTVWMVQGVWFFHRYCLDTWTTWTG